MRRGQRLARGERFLRTPGTRHALFFGTRPEGTGGPYRGFGKGAPATPAGVRSLFLFLSGGSQKALTPANLFPPFQGGRATRRLENRRLMSMCLENKNACNVQGKSPRSKLNSGSPKRYELQG